MQYSYRSVTHADTLALSFPPFPPLSLNSSSLPISSCTHNPYLSAAHFHFPTTSSRSALPFTRSISRSVYPSGYIETVRRLRFFRSCAQIRWQAVETFWLFTKASMQLSIIICWESARIIPSQNEMCFMIKKREREFAQ